MSEVAQKNKISGAKNVAKKKRFSRRTKIQLIFVFLIIFGLAYAWHQISAPVVGQKIVTKNALKKQVTTTKPTAPASDITNPYFSLSLPQGYRPQANNQAVPGMLFQQTIIRPSSFGSVVINISVKQLPDGGLQGDSSYQLRIKSPARYTMSQLNVNGETVMMASDAESAAVVVFWVHGGYLATISASSGLGNPAQDNNETQKKALQPVLDAWRWQ